MNIRWPLTGHITSPYGDTKNRPRPHTGTDIRGDTGAMIKAGAAGRVHHVGDWAGSPNAGKVAMVDHAVPEGTLRLIYCHVANKFSVKAGQEIDPGADLAPVGTTGTSQGGHTHIEAFLNGERVNPERYLSGTVPAGGDFTPIIIEEEEDDMAKPVIITNSKNVGIIIDWPNGTWRGIYGSETINHEKNGAVVTKAASDDEFEAIKKSLRELKPNAPQVTAGGVTFPGGFTGQFTG